LIINSPVGRFPFELTSVKRRGRLLVLNGEMGNWPTSVEIGAKDVPAVLMRLRPVIAPVMGAAALAILVAVRARSRR
jgi:hypothetical protein